MSLPTPQLITHARKANEPMANRDTPFIYNEWYVAAFTHEVGRHLLARRLLDRRVVLFRTLAGDAVALEDRCAHRSFPLSRSQLDGDSIVCGYHGFRYDAAGDLVEVPSQKTCPRGIGVRRYPLLSQGPLLWIWLGDAERADTTQIPPLAWIDAAEWACTSGYFHHPGNYVSLHENLMDLTHLSFLHANTIGTPDYASAPYKLDLKEGHYRLIREVVPTTLAPVWGQTTGLGQCATAARIATSEFLSPGLHQVSVSFYDSALPAAQREQFNIRTAHILTPETTGSLHYFIVHGRDFARHDQALGQFMHEQLFAAFNEDVEGLGALEAALDAQDEHHYEISVASDAPAVATRMYLKRRAEAERQAG
ncbi:Rieske 2Fe-2S domain-containing protein [Pseudomonas sp. Fl5BN2]|uniref:aromatic ring-hydroxylating dioxygenase subunit alpha n=1 Tax=Pseudomonas sp. Fl5BN2 TaxID=2697652 RepID=UPI00137838C0|nr:aromatic ring-hydroxylating dioxygenase subunit alpha [Pseudomonas sp. Fl5BN2]NBF06568.1 Rieske 2Fe-2S domain-containing protein [Pseudomonas sp. Fl5BN2]